MLPVLTQSLFLGFTVLFTYTWTHHPGLSAYNLQLSAFLIVAYFALRLFVKSTKLFNLESTIILVMITLLLVFSTGGLTSPLFFLLDFLLFALVLLFEPSLTAILATIIILIFVGEQLIGQTTDFVTGIALTNLVSLTLITPLALLFGRKFMESQQAAGKIKILEKEIQADQEDTLLWVATQARPDLIKILDTLSQIIASNNLPYHLQNKLRTTYEDLVALGQSANQLELEVKKRSEDM